MTQTVTSTLGKFVWHELMVPDLDAAKRFYGGLFGWTFKESTTSGTRYIEFAAGENVQGGMMASPTNGDIPPHWMGYVNVADVDHAAEVAKANGGQVLVSPTDIPDVGRFAIVLDPQGGAFAPFKSAHYDRPDTELPGPGTFCWDQLNVADPAAVLGFYSRVAGWGLQDFNGMTVFTRGDKQAASVMQAPPGAPGHWLCYVVAGDLAAARAKVAELGGEVLVEDVSIPGVGSIAVVKDNQGVVFGLFSL